jgi:2-dehydro-3-deoxygalactonokinase
MKKVLSCDWGTTSLRLKLVDVSDNQILTEINTSQGISSTFNAWKESGKPEEERLSFYLTILCDNIRRLEENIGSSLDTIPLIISGMASASIGMIELPYKKVPFLTDGSDLELHRIAATPEFPHQISIIPGIRTENDVMRGEETQLIGCPEKYLENELLYIFPGTHSKHVRVKGNQAIDFKTYLTGELFELFSEKSVLSGSVGKAELTGIPAYEKSFEQGVREGARTNILHSCFLVRTNTLFNKLSREENYLYLSGLLIGAELNDIIPFQLSNIIITGMPVLSDLYKRALRILGSDTSSFTIEIADPEKAIINGQLLIFLNDRNFQESRY